MYRSGPRGARLQIDWSSSAVSSSSRRLEPLLTGSNMRGAPSEEHLFVWEAPSSALVTQFLFPIKSKFHLAVSPCRVAE